MKKSASIVLTILMLILAVSCMQVETKVDLKKDGSGTIDLTMVMHKEMVIAMTGSAKNIQNPFSKEDFISVASRYGQGVTLVSYEEVKNDKQLGGKAIYKFEDINQLKISAIPETDKTAGGAGDGPGSDGGEVSFSYSKQGQGGLLTIHLNDNDEKEDKAPEESAEEKEKSAQLMKQILKDMKITMEITVDGKVTSSNATFREGSKIILYNIDFNQILKSDSAFDTFLSNDMNKKALNKVKGVTIEEKKSVDVNFK